MRWFRNRLPALLLAAPVLLAACTENSPTGPAPAPQFNVVGEPAIVLLKKVGPTPPYTFNLTATVGTLPFGNTVTMGTGDWVQVWEATSAAQGTGTFTATEVLQAGSQVDSISVVELVRGSDGFLHEGDQTITRGVNLVSIPVSFDKGAYVIVWNSGDKEPPPPPPPGGKDGCTPGFWKQSQHFDRWTAPYTPNTLFDAVFANAFPGMTLLAVLNTGGGGLNALGRHTVAALLNAANPDLSYGVSASEIISAFNAAFASGDYETLKNRFEGLNERGCPLD